MFPAVPGRRCCRCGRARLEPTLVPGGPSARPGARTGVSTHGRMRGARGSEAAPGGMRLCRPLTEPRNLQVPTLRVASPTWDGSKDLKLPIAFLSLRWKSAGSK